MNTLHVVYLTLVVGNSLFLSKSQECSESTLVPNNDFDFDSLLNPPYLKEAFLQIFESRRIPCNGTLTEFLFYATSDQIQGVHLCVFRPVGNGEFLIVGETYLTGTLNGDAAANSWVTIPANPLIDVNPGDFLGIYYDDIFVLSGKIVISSLMPTGVLDTRVVRIDGNSGELGPGATVKAGDSGATDYTGRTPLFTGLIQKLAEETTTESATTTVPTTPPEPEPTTRETTMPPEPPTTLGPDLTTTTAEQTTTTGEETTTTEEATTTTEEATTTTAPVFDPRCFVSFKTQTQICQSAVYYVMYDRLSRQCVRKHGCLWLNYEMTFPTIDECSAACKNAHQQGNTFDRVTAIPERIFRMPGMFNNGNTLRPPPNFGDIPRPNQNRAAFGSFLQHFMPHQGQSRGLPSWPSFFPG